MKRQKHYPGALVPEYLSSLTIEKLPVDQPYFVDPGDPTDDSGNEAIAIFVTDDRQLRMNRTEIIDPDDTYVQSPIGKVGVMKTMVVDPNQGFREVYVADLRFIDSNAILDIGNQSIAGNDQELFMEWADMVSNSVVFEGFVAPEFGDEFDIDEDLPPGVFYGNPELHSALKKLRKRGNKMMARFMKQQANPTRIEPDAATEAAQDSGASKDNQKSLEIHFSHRR